MKNREEILKELRDIAPELAAIEKRNNYTVPESYFAEFSTSMLGLVKPQTVTEELKAIAPELAKIDFKGTTEVPSGFFETFSTQMAKKVQMEELREVAPALANLPKVNMHEVPAMYFSSFPQQVMKQIIAEQKANETAVTPAWLIKLNAAVEDVIAIFFKPGYTVAFAGIASVLVIGMLFSTVVEKQCSDVDCKMAQLTNDEIDAYLLQSPDSYTDEIFELNETENQQSITITASETFSNALNSLTDEELNNAILD